MKTSTFMKKSWLLLLLTVITLSSCKKDFDVPPVEIPVFNLPAGATLISIKELKARHQIIGTIDSINDDVYISGIVTANDESGNFYKCIYIQDTSAGIYIGLDKTSLYNIYKVGQRLFVKCKGLFLGDYGGMTQLGSIYNGAIGRIPEVYIKNHLFRDSLPGTPPAPKILSIADINNSHLGMLIKLQNVSFVEVGQPFATSTATTNRTITDGTNNLTLRTSNYANFASTPIPDGTGSITGIISIYNSGYQLYIRDLNDLSGFDYSTRIIASENFSTSGSLGTFTQYSVLGDQVWTQSSYNNVTFAKMSGYSNGSYYANEDWLISPSVNLDLYSNEKLKFFSMMNYGTAGDGSLRIYYSTDYVSGNPTLATWTEMTGIPLSGGGWANVSSGDVDISFINGSNVHFAFKYTCSTTNVATWEIGGFMIKGKIN